MAIGKLTVKVDVDQGPALHAILRLVKVFGSGVEAEEIEKAGALAEAYAFIEHNLKTQIGPTGTSGSKDVKSWETITRNVGHYADVVLHSGEKLSGRIDGLAKLGFYLRSNADVYLSFAEIAYVTIVKSNRRTCATTWVSARSLNRTWTRGVGSRLVDFLKRHADEKVVLREVRGTEVAGRLLYNMFSAVGDYYAFEIIEPSGMHYPIKFESVEWVECVE